MQQDRGEAMGSSSVQPTDLGRTGRSPHTRTRPLGRAAPSRLDVAARANPAAQTAGNVSTGIAKPVLHKDAHSSPRCSGARAPPQALLSYSTSQSLEQVPRGPHHSLPSNSGTRSAASKLRGLGCKTSHQPRSTYGPRARTTMRGPQRRHVGGGQDAPMRKTPTQAYRSHPRQDGCRYPP